MKRACGALLLLLLLGRGTVAAGEAPTAEAVADAVAAAAQSDDAATLEALLGREEPDPWLVAHVLLRRGQRATAARWATAGTRPEIAGLAAVLAEEIDVPAYEAECAAVGQAEAALAAGQPGEALAALRERPRAPHGIGAVLVHATRGRALAARAAARDEAGARTQDLEAAAAAHVAATDEAERLGWWTRASEEVYTAGRALFALDSDVPPERLVGLFERQRTLEERLHSPVGVGRAHYRIATALWTSGALERLAEHVAQAEALLAPTEDREYLAKVLALRAQLLDVQGRSREAFESSCRASAAIEQVGAEGLAPRFRPDALRIARSRAEMLLVCASMAGKVGEERLARVYAQRAVAAAARVEDPYLRAFVEAFLQVLEGARQDYGGAPLRAIAAWDQARTLYVELGSAVDVADLDLRVGSLLLRIGNLPEAGVRMDRAITALEGLRARRELSWALRWGGTLRRMQGRLDEATDQLARAGTLAVELRDVALQCEVWGEQARLAEVRGDFAQALTHAHEGLAVAARAQLTDQLAAIRTYAAGLQARLGNVEGARTLIEQAKQALQSLGRAANLRVTYREEALLLLRLGEHAAAHEILEKLVPLYEAVEDRLGLAYCQRMLGASVAATGDFAGAVEHYEQAYALQQAMERRDSAVQARIDLTLAQYHAGDRQAALEDLLAAHQAAVDLGQPELRASAAKVLAAVYTAEGRPAEAMLWARRALDEVTDFGLDLPEGEDAALRGTYAPLYDIGARAALALDDGPALFHFLERGRASTLVAALGGVQAMRQAKVKPELRGAEETARAAVVMAQARQRAASFGEAGDARRAVQAAQETLRAALDRIRLDVHMQADLAYGRVPTIEELCGEFAPEEVFVLYGQVGESMVAIVVDCEDARVKKLGASKDVVAAVAALVGPQVDRVDEGAAAAVRKLLIAPLALPKTVRRLIVSPGEALAFVPFGLLDMEREVVLIQSTATLLALRKARSAGGTQILALGDPDYLPYRRAGERMAQLDATRGEVEEIGNLALVDKEASETNFYAHLRTADGRALRPWRAIHLACHGLVDMSRALASRLVLSVDAHNDGLLETREIFQLELQADLVVLSACDTGRGKVIAGDGLSGLVRAFMQAGAPRVICSLWKVDDEASSELMKAFYERWNAEDPKQRLSAPAALRAAQKHVREHLDVTGKAHWAHPRYWAAWVLWGLPN